MRYGRQLDTTGNIELGRHALALGGRIRKASNIVNQVRAHLIGGIKELAHLV